MMQWKVNWRTGIATLAVLALAVSTSNGAVKHVFVHSPSLADLANIDADFVLKTDDLLAGLPATDIKLNTDLFEVAPDYYEIIYDMPNPVGPCLPLTSQNAGISGFHGASGDPLVAKTKLIDGLEGADVDSVLTDFAWPAAVFQFNLPAPTDIGEIRVYAANERVGLPGGPDGRVFQDYDVEISTDMPDPVEDPNRLTHTFTPLISEVITSVAICAAPGDGFIPNVNDGSQTGGLIIGSTLTRVFDDTNTVMATGVTSIRFTFYAVSNTQKTYWDRYLGPVDRCGGPPAVLWPDDPATYFDAEDHDGYKRPFESSIIKEIDVLPVRTAAIEICDNTLDDDNDGLIDGDDPDCFGDRTSCPPEVCDNGVDDNGNTLVDCDDPDCREDTICQLEICDNGIDDNDNGLIDCEDPQCSEFFPDCVCSDPVFDVDFDDDVDHEDFAVFQLCFTGTDDPGNIFDTLPIECQCMDVNGIQGVADSAISEDDFSIFEACATGPEIPIVDTTCDDGPFGG